MRRISICLLLMISTGCYAGGADTLNVAEVEYYIDHIGVKHFVNGDFIYSGVLKESKYELDENWTTYYLVMGGMITEERFYNQKGTLQYFTEYKGGKPAHQTFYYDNGEKYIEEFYGPDGQTPIRQIKWDEQGNLISEK